MSPTPVVYTGLNSTTAILAMVGIGVAGFVAYQYITAPSRPTRNPDTQPAPNPGGTPAPNPGGAPAPNPGGAPAPGNNPAPEYTLGQRCKDLKMQLRNLDGERQTKQQQQNAVIANVDGSGKTIEKWAHINLKCIWDCNDQLRGRWDCAYEYIKGLKDEKGCWGLDMSLLRPARQEWARLQDEINLINNQEKDVQTELANLSKQGVRC